MIEITLSTVVILFAYVSVFLVSVFLAGYFFRKRREKGKSGNPNWEYYYDQGFEVGHQKGYANGKIQGLKDFIEP